jgi:lipopolysaccharide kinase (Kdo/WaaP) family protein
MVTPRVKLAPAVPDWDSLGLADPTVLFAGGSMPRGSQLVEEREGVERWRTPLPGTVLADGRRNGKPRGVGTGWLRVTRWTRPALGDVLRARFTQPASISLAERAWNLACALRAAGISTAEPLAVASEDRAVAARRSILVTRELEKMLPLSDWLERFDRPHDRAVLARGLGSFLQRLANSGVRPAQLEFDTLVAHEKSGGRSDCAVEQIREIQDRSLVGGLAVSALPELALAEVLDGRSGVESDAADRIELVRQLARSLPESVQPTPAEALRCLRGALGQAATRQQRHAAARQLFGAARGEVRHQA